MEKLLLSEGEWKIMNVLWEKHPRSLMELVHELEEETAWSKSTVFVMMKRLVAKGAVEIDTEGRLQQYSPLIEKADAAEKETGSFLSKVYNGSLGLMVSSMAGGKGLSKSEIDELRRILDEAESKLDSKE